MTSRHAVPQGENLFNKVPEVTVFFWAIKVLCTTVGEAAADFLNVNLNLGLTGTSIVTGALLLVVLAAQFRAGRYRPGLYWLSVALVSVFGTLVTDNLTDQMGVPLEASTLVFAVLLALVFWRWYSAERTLSIHSIVTMRREAFYWLAVLVTFALGTAAGDLMAEVLGFGYLASGVIVASLVAFIVIAWRLGLDAILSFWLVYILTRPLGASVGDYLAQSRAAGGLGLGAAATSAAFAVAILALVIYLSASKVDVAPVADPTPGRAQRNGLAQTVAVLALLIVAASVGYAWRTSTLAESSPSAAPSATTSPTAEPSVGQGSPGVATMASSLGDLTPFRVITQDTLGLLDRGDQAGATARIGDLETAWDNAEARLRPHDRASWTEIDDKIDTALRALRSTRPDPTGEHSALTALLSTLH